jgi:putative Holliday junction resolvase
MALDVGTKTVGVALCDEGRMLARPLLTVARRGVRQDVAVLLEIVRREAVVGIVVGLPLALDGAETRMVRLARQVGEALAELSGLPMAWQDERFSSIEAENRLIAAGRRGADRKARIDQAAAAVILQDFLDGPQGKTLGARV